MPLLPIDAPTLKSSLDQGNVTLIDVREKDEFEEATIPDAALHPLSTFNPQAIASSDTTKLVFYCLGGKRSHIAASNYLATNPNATVYNLQGGIIAWDQAGYDIIPGTVTQTL